MQSRFTLESLVTLDFSVDRIRAQTSNALLFYDSFKIETLLLGGFDCGPMSSRSLIKKAPVKANSSWHESDIAYSQLESYPVIISLITSVADLESEYSRVYFSSNILIRMQF